MPEFIFLISHVLRSRILGLPELAAFAAIVVLLPSATTPQLDKLGLSIIVVQPGACALPVACDDTPRHYSHVDKVGLDINVSPAACALPVACHGRPHCARRRAGPVPSPPSGLSPRPPG